MKNNRLQSLDALRGFDMFFISGGAAVLSSIANITNCDWLAQQMGHVAWHGFSAFDMIFPLFLFIAGISFPFSLSKYKQTNTSNNAIYGRILKRTAILFVLGLIYNGLLKFEGVRFASVLGRIGFAWAFAALIFVNTKQLWVRLAWLAGILLGYFLLLHFSVAPDADTVIINDTLRSRVPEYVLAETGSYSLRGSIVGYVDRLLLPGSKYLVIADPEGILSTIPAIATALLGMLTGVFVQNKTGFWKGQKIALYMAFAGAVLLLTGWLWGFVMPINKNLWTSSFVCFVGGLSLMLFAMFYYIIDVCSIRKWAFFFTVIGLNSITVYMAQAMVSFTYTANFIFGGTAKLLCQPWGDLALNLAYVTVVWAFLYFLYKQKIFLKI